MIIDAETVKEASQKGRSLWHEAQEISSMKWLAISQSQNQERSLPLTPLGAPRRRHGALPLQSAQGTSPSPPHPQFQKRRLFLEPLVHRDGAVFSRLTLASHVILSPSGHRWKGVAFFISRTQQTLTQASPRYVGLHGSPHFWARRSNLWRRPCRSS